MPLEPHRNIDKRAQLPEGIEFRADFLWSKIEEKQNPRKKKPAFWWGVAACAIFGIGYAIYPSQEEVIMSEPVISEVLGPEVEVVEALKEEVSEIKAIVPKKVDSISSRKLAANVGGPFDSIPQVDLKQPELQRVVLPLIAIVPVKEKPIEPKLSPAALRLQKSLQRLDSEKASDQTLIVEKFNLLQELRHYPTQVASNQESPSIFNSLIKGKNEKN